MARYVIVNGVKYDESEVDGFMDYDYDPDGSYWDDQEEIANTKYDIMRKQNEELEVEREGYDDL